MGKNIYKFKKLSPKKQQELIDYIANSLYETQSFNFKLTAYGLKQHFTFLYGDADEHVTSHCFMEAMLHSGYKARAVFNASEPNWYFNVKRYKPKRYPRAKKKRNSLNIE